jgi:hypothetical protein
VDDVVGALQSGESFGTEQAMSIRDHAEDHGLILADGREDARRFTYYCGLTR